MASKTYAGKTVEVDEEGFYLSECCGTIVQYKETE